MQSARYFYQILMKPECSRYIFKKSQVSYFIENRSVGAELLHADGRTDGRKEGRTDMGKLILQFDKRAKKFLGFNSAFSQHVFMDPA